MGLIPVADALASVLDGATPLATQAVALTAAHRRVLASDLAALRTQPPQPMSAMDGYALRAIDAHAGARLHVVGEVAAGRPFGRAIGAQEAARIFTGGVMPDGTDAVVIQEDATRDGDFVVVNETSSVGKNVRPAGIDFREGDVLLRAGRRLSDRDLALAAGMNHPKLSVHRRPKVALLATGDELVMPGNPLAPGQIVYSNGYALHALLRSEGAEILDLGVAADTLPATIAGIRAARDAGADILVTTGGASVGDHDLVQQALRDEGATMAFWRIALRPGKPMMHGRIDAMRVLGLPGNPVSSYVCAFLFVVPLIRALSGRRDIAHFREPVTSGRDLAANDHREDYLRATLTRGNEGALLATPVSRQDSSLLGHLAGAQALIVRSPHAPAAARGTEVEMIRLPDEAPV